MPYRTSAHWKSTNGPYRALLREWTRSKNIDKRSLDPLGGFIAWAQHAEPDDNIVASSSLLTSMEVVKTQPASVLASTAARTSAWNAGSSSNLEGHTSTSSLVPTTTTKTLARLTNRAPASTGLNLVLEQPAGPEDSIEARTSTLTNRNQLPGTFFTTATTSLSRNQASSTDTLSQPVGSSISGASIKVGPSTSVNLSDDVSVAAALAQPPGPNPSMADLSNPNFSHKKTPVSSLVKTITTSPSSTRSRLQIQPS